MFRAYRKSFNFCTPTEAERYRSFITKHIWNHKPNLYSVISQKTIDTPHGEMQVLKLSPDITNPHYEPIIECYINNEAIYLWQDSCWTIAVDKNGNKIIKYSEQYWKVYPIGTDSADDINWNRHICKTLVVHNIGQPPEQKDAS